MDILVCEAPLDNSFQKEKLELVNKGSLSHRRKPSRANIKNLLSPSNHNTSLPERSSTPVPNPAACNGKLIVHDLVNCERFKKLHLTNQQVQEPILIIKSPEPSHDISSPSDSIYLQPRSSTPVPATASCNKKLIVNGFAKSERFGEHSLRPQQGKEPNLIRTSPEPNHVADAQQFSIEAKLKRKKSEGVSRSAVLIQTWERRTWTDSLTKQKETKERSTNSCQPTKDKNSKTCQQTKGRSSKSYPENCRCTKTCDRCCRGKENTFKSRTMPEPHANQRYPSGNGKKVEKGGFPSRNQDSYSNDAMLYRVPDNSPNYIKQLNKNGRKPTTVSQEPEWISLSKKLCAKFVEGYIEPHSTDSYLHEEPEGVKKPQPEKEPPNSIPRFQNKVQTIPQRVVEDRIPKTKVVENHSSQKMVVENPVNQKMVVENHINKKMLVENHINKKMVVENHIPQKTVVENHIPQKIVMQNRFMKKMEVEDQKSRNKVVEAMTPSHVEDSNGAEPPWVHLSRKLCTKFIEEHIEYPVVPSVEPSKKALLVEPNGDVRIIEKVGKPKERKSKVRKETEPEWVSISRKLRAKFIESHIDDPDTISMDNQLNASDPELSSESLSDNSQDVMTTTKESSSDTKYTDFYQRNVEKAQALELHRNSFQTNNYRHTPPAEEEESHWEYQEIEFDEESNAESFEDSINDYRKTSVTDNYKNSPERNTVKQNSSRENGEHFISFAETVNSQTFRNTECYNNDVRFAPHVLSPDKQSCNGSEHNKKLTVNFVSNRDRTNHDINNRNASSSSPDRNNGQNAFFNLTTWEEAHRKVGEHTAILKLNSEFRSKSMDNICDSDEVYINQMQLCNGKQYPNINYHDNLQQSTVFKSEDVLDKLDCKISTRNEGNRTRKIGCFEDNVYKTRIDQINGHSEIFEVDVESERVNALKSSSSDSFESFEIAPESYENNAEPFIESNFENEILKGLNRSEKDTSSAPSIHKSNNEKREDFEPNQNTKSLKITENNFRMNSVNNFEKCNGDSVHEQSKENGLVNFDRNGNESSLIYREDKNIKEKSKDYKVPEHINQKNCIARNMYNEISSTDENDNSINVFDEVTISNEVGNEITNNCHKSIKVTGERTKPTEGIKNPESHQFKSSNYQEMNIDVNQNKNGKSPTNSENSQSPNSSTEEKPTGMKKHFKCNGFIANSKKSKSSENSNDLKNKNETKISNGIHTEYHKQKNNNKSLTPKQEIACVNEYANISSVIAERQSRCEESDSNMGQKSKSMVTVFRRDCDDEECFMEQTDFRRNSSGEQDKTSDTTSITDVSSFNENADLSKKSGVKAKSKSMYDLSKNGNVFTVSKVEESKDKSTLLNGSTNGIVKSNNGSVMTFQEFASESDIPLCAKLVSKQNGKLSARSVSSSSNRTSSRCSESSHVYEDMFKETTSCPSDSETSSWTVMKKNSYYINGRSSSMNDLDLSDSCSMSVKCDYASSGSEQSTLQSRHSSCTSSSFYVNLRDYDSHMLEPSLNKKKKESKKSTNNGKSAKASNSNPPTPESLRHLFTSPFHSIHSSTNRTTQLINRMPNEPESHYYSTAAAASSAFKHGFDPTPPKQKKTERSSSVKIKDIAQGIMLTFRRFQNLSKSSNNVSAVDVSHLAESNPTDFGKQKSKKGLKEHLKKQEEKRRWRFSSENIRTDSDSGCHLTSSDIQGPKARRSSSDLSGVRPKMEVIEKKKTKSGKKASNAREKSKKTRSKSIEPRPLSTVSRKVQQMPDGTLYLVTTVSGDTGLPGVYSDSPDSSSELSSHRPVKVTGESNC
ncbi:hypothetical protein JTE90_022895 [Oedothorax gibbosus]|uniref:Uncharacterized protein n=1 Tax=Oedothorax gibbosus TaxID=931172 RepID=A0AAV6UUN0_9ARAC|nr:hypothetical protein JTE90_022895 [Oedothorax gibbosus]